MTILAHGAEAALPPVKGTADRPPADFARLARVEATLLDCFHRAGYDRLATPILEPVELHERKSGAGIVSKLFLVSGTGATRACLRPELTAGVVRAYAAVEPAPALPWRVSHSGAAFRHEDPARPDRLREFQQVGLERLGDAGPYADAEVIWLASWALAESGVRDVSIRVGHVGLILEILSRSGLPRAAQAALIETLSEAAAEGGDAGSIERGLDHFEAWLRQAARPDDDGIGAVAAAVDADGAGIDRLFRTLVPVVTGRRSRSEIVDRLRLKWNLGHELLDQLGRVRTQVRALANLRGAPAEVLDRLTRDFANWAPDSVAALRTLFESLAEHGVDPAAVTLDLGLGRGIGFYSQMIFDLTAATPGGPVELGGGGRYDGLARVLGSDRDDRGVGFAFGLERIDQVLRDQAQRGGSAAVAPRAILVIPADPAATSAAVRLAADVRAAGGRAILESGWLGPDRAGRARELGARWSLVVRRPAGGEAHFDFEDHERRTKRDGSAQEVIRWVADLLREADR